MNLKSKTYILLSYFACIACFLTVNSADITRKRLLNNISKTIARIYADYDPSIEIVKARNINAKQARKNNLHTNDKTVFMYINDMYSNGLFGINVGIGTTGMVKFFLLIHNYINCCAGIAHLLDASNTVQELLQEIKDELNQKEIFANLLNCFDQQYCNNIYQIPQEIQNIYQQKSTINKDSQLFNIFLLATARARVESATKSYDSSFYCSIKKAAENNMQQKDISCYNTNIDTRCSKQYRYQIPLEHKEKFYNIIQTYRKNNNLNKKRNVDQTNNERKHFISEAQRLLQNKQYSDLALSFIYTVIFSRKKLHIANEQKHNNKIATRKKQWQHNDSSMQETDYSDTTTTSSPQTSEQLSTYDEQSTYQDTTNTQNSCISSCNTSINIQDIPTTEKIQQPDNISSSPNNSKLQEVMKFIEEQNLTKDDTRKLITHLIAQNNFKETEDQLTILESHIPQNNPVFNNNETHLLKSPNTALVPHNYTNITDKQMTQKQSRMEFIQFR